MVSDKPSQDTSSEEPEEKIEGQQPAEVPANSHAEGLFSRISSIAENVWDTVVAAEATLAHAAEAVVKEKFPHLTVAADDTAANQSIWDLLDKDSETADTASLKGAGATKVEAAKSEDKSWFSADGPFGWLMADWKPQYGVEKVGSDGQPCKTQWGDGRVSHIEKGCATVVDGEKALHSDAAGNNACFDRSTGTLSEVGKHGTKASVDHAGQLSVEDDQGNKLEWKEGHLLATSKDGSTTEITDQRIIRRFKHSAWHLDLARRKGVKPPEGAEGPSVGTTDDDTDKSKQMVVINDGKGTVINIYDDGRKQIAVGEGADKITFYTEKGNKDIIAVRGDDIYTLSPGEKPGDWNVLKNGEKLDDKAEDQVADELVKALGISADGKLIVSSTTTITADGGISTVDEQGKEVIVAADGNAAVLKGAGGPQADVVVQTNGGTATVTTPDSTTTVNTETAVVAQTTVLPSGESRDLFTLDPNSDNYLTIGTADGQIKCRKDGNGHEMFRLWSGDVIDGTAHKMTFNDGTIFDADKGLITFADGTTVDDQGNIFDDDGIRLGSLGDSWSEEERELEAQAQALASDAQGQIAIIKAAIADGKPPNLAGLLAIRGQLGSMLAASTAAGDLGSSLQLSGAMSEADGAIASANIQQAQQAYLQQITSVDPELLAQVHHLMPNGASPEALKQILVQSGRLEQNQA